MKKLIYNLLRVPDQVIDCFRATCDAYKWELSAFTMENLDGSFYVPGTVLGKCQEPWLSIKAKIPACCTMTVAASISAPTRVISGHVAASAPAPKR